MSIKTRNTGSYFSFDYVRKLAEIDVDLFADTLDEQRVKECYPLFLKV